MAFLVYGFCAQLLLAGVGTSATCDLEPWLNTEHDADKGYHVLCVRENGVADVHVDGVVGARIFELTIDDAFASTLETQLHIKDEMVFLPTQGPTGQGVWTEGMVHWPKQSWAIFTASGNRIPLGSEAVELASYKGVALLFEGGVWRWPSIRRDYERPVLPGVLLRTVSMKPGLFELVFVGKQDQGGLSRKLLDGVVERSKNELRPSLTEFKVTSIRTSEQTWLDYGSSPGLRRLSELITEMVHIPGNYFEENLQVLRYKKGQFYDAHRDYWDPREFPDPNRFLKPGNSTWMNRHATVFWYLQTPEDGGDTWFPRAHGGAIPWDEWTACDHRGAKMGGRNGTVAILFYSLHSDGDIDEFSWHCGCPVKEGVKWAANSWIWNQPRSGQRNPVRHQGLRKPWSEKSAKGGKGGASQDAAQGDEAQNRQPLVIFRNSGSVDVQMVWVDSGGKEEPLGTLSPEGSQSFDSIVGHVFRIRTGGILLREYTVAPAPSKQIVDVGNSEL